MCLIQKILSSVFRKVARLISRKGSIQVNKRARKPRLQFDDFVEDATLQCDLAFLPVKELVHSCKKFKTTRDYGASLYSGVELPWIKNTTCNVRSDATTTSIVEVVSLPPTTADPHHDDPCVSCEVPYRTSFGTLFSIVTQESNEESNALIDSERVADRETESHLKMKLQASGACSRTAIKI